MTRGGLREDKSELLFVVEAQYGRVAFVCLEHSVENKKLRGRKVISTNSFVTDRAACEEDMWIKNAMTEEFGVD